MILTRKELRKWSREAREPLSAEQERIILDRFGTEPFPCTWTEQDIAVQLAHFVGCGEFVKDGKDKGCHRRPRKVAWLSTRAKRRQAVLPIIDALDRIYDGEKAFRDCMPFGVENSSPYAISDDSLTLVAQAIFFLREAYKPSLHPPSLENAVIRKERSGRRMRQPGNPAPSRNIQDPPIPWRTNPSETEQGDEERQLDIFD